MLVLTHQSGTGQDADDSAVAGVTQNGQRGCIVFAEAIERDVERVIQHNTRKIRAFDRVDLQKRDRFAEYQCRLQIRTGHHPQVVVLLVDDHEVADRESFTEFEKALSTVVGSDRYWWHQRHVADGELAKQGEIGGTADADPRGSEFCGVDALDREGGRR
jgi:hypothetical protein